LVIVLELHTASIPQNPRRRKAPHARSWPLPSPLALSESLFKKNARGGSLPLSTT
jgi:hypothetical protein